MTDFAEIVLNAFDPTTAPLHFNPRVADVPEMDVLITAAPLIYLRLTEANGETRTFATSHTTATTTTVTDSTTDTNTQTDTASQSLGHTTSVMRQLAREVGITAPRDAGQDAARDAGADGGRDAGAEVVQDESGPITVTISNGTSTTNGRSSSSTLSISFTHEESRALSETLTRAEEYARSHEIVTSNGVRAVLALIVNRGGLPFRVTNLVLSASLLTADGIEIPVGNLDIHTIISVFQPYSLGPGEQLGPVNFDKDFLNLDTVAAVLRNLQGLTLRVGVYELSDGAGKPYAFDVGLIKTRTATLSIDYGKRRPPERHLVATNLDPASPGVSAARALHEILRIPVQSDPESGLTSVRDVVADASGNGHWVVYHRSDNGSDVTRTSYTPPYDLSRIVLRAGDTLRLIWVEP
jgi:hypothetical protein